MKNKTENSKIEEIRDYAKCVYANKFTLTGYIGLAVTAATCIIFKQPQIIEDITSMSFVSELMIGSYSLISLVGTAFGLETLDSYRTTKQQIEKYGKPSNRYYNKNIMYYCDTAGIKLAAKEADLEHLLIKKN